MQNISCLPCFVNAALKMLLQSADASVFARGYAGTRCEVRSKAICHWLTKLNWKRWTLTKRKRKKAPPKHNMWCWSLFRRLWNLRFFSRRFYIYFSGIFVKSTVCCQESCPGSWWYAVYFFRGCWLCRIPVLSSVWPSDRHCLQTRWMWNLW